MKNGEYKDKQIILGLGFEIMYNKFVFKSIIDYEIVFSINFGNWEFVKVYSWSKNNL